MDNTKNRGLAGLDTDWLQPSLFVGIRATSILANVLTLSEARKLYPSIAIATFYRKCGELVTRRTATNGPVLTTLGEVMRVFGEPEEVLK